MAIIGVHLLGISYFQLFIISFRQWELITDKEYQLLKLLKLLSWTVDTFFLFIENLTSLYRQQNLATDGLLHVSYDLLTWRYYILYKNIYLKDTKFLFLSFTILSSAQCNINFTANIKRNGKIVQPIMITRFNYCHSAEYSVFEI